MIFKQPVFYMIFGLILILSGIFFFISTGFKPLQFLSRSSISKPAEREIKSVTGTIVKLSNTVLSIQTNEGVKNYIITKTFDFQKLIEGNIQKGNAKTIPVSFDSLKLNQQVLVLSEKNSNHAISIYIVSSP